MLPEMIEQRDIGELDVLYPGDGGTEAASEDEEGDEEGERKTTLMVVNDCNM